MTRIHRTCIGFAAGAAALALAAGLPAQAEDPVVHVYNWVDYIGETTLADFEKDTGIKVVYDTYDASETVDAKLMAGAGAWVAWHGLPSVVVLAAGAALVVYLVRAARAGRSLRHEEMAFGPYIAGGFWLVWLYGGLSYS